MWTEESRSHVAQMLESERNALELLLAEHERISGAIANKRARVELLEELVAQSRARSQRGRQSQSSPSTGGLQEGSRIARAHAYLREEGDSRHVRDILLALGETDSPGKRNGLSSQIHRYIEAGRYFRRDETRGRRFFAVIGSGDGEADDTPA